MTFTDDVVRDLLISVGLDPETAAQAWERTFAELDLDSLARVEIATRIQDRFGIDIEESLTEDATPAQLKKLVTERLAPAGA
jgi:acyl carrier protein